MTAKVRITADDIYEAWNNDPEIEKLMSQALSKLYDNLTAQFGWPAVEQIADTDAFYPELYVCPSFDDEEAEDE